MTKRKRSIWKTRLIIPLIMLSFFPIAAQPHLSIGDTFDKESFQREVQYYTQLLGFDSSVFMYVRFSMSLDERANAVITYRKIFDDKHQIMITINKLASRSDQLMAVAHELVHARQFIEGRLKEIESDVFQWEEKDIIDIRLRSYEQRPWEQEAIHNAVHMRRDYLSHTKDLKRMSAALVASEAQQQP